MKLKKRKIILAKHAGFCTGVKRAVKIAQNSLKYDTIVVDGELVHNKDVIKDLKGKGLIMWDGKEVKKGTKVLIKAHGTTKGQEDYFIEKKCVLIDATCPHVKKIHKIAEEAKRR